jgi:hypothetical protein
VLSADPYVWKMLVGFVALQTLSLALSKRHQHVLQPLRRRTAELDGDLLVSCMLFLRKASRTCGSRSC